MILFKRFRLFLVGTICALVCLSIALFFVSRTDWFQTSFRSRVLTSLEQATGAKVTVGSMRFDLKSRTAEFTDLVLRGSEPAGSTPLFEAPLIRVQFTISGVLRPAFHIASIVISRPELCVVIAPDGSTNLPSPPREKQREIYRELVNMGIDRFELSHALIRLNEEALPFNAKGSMLKLLWTRPQRGARSNISLTSRNVFVQYKNSLPEIFDLDLSAQLVRDRIQVTNLWLKTGQSSLRASGMISHLSQPSALFQADAQLASVDLARLPDLTDLTGGSAAFQGSIAYLPSQGLSVHGTVIGDRLAYKSSVFNIRDVSLSGNIQASSADNIRVSDLSITSPLARLSGTAAITEYGRMSIDADLLAANIQGIAAAAGRPIPWSGNASGHVAINGSYQNQAALNAKANLSIKPLKSGIPISGEIHASLIGAHNVNFEDSRLELPGTRISFSGVPNAKLQLSLASSRLEDLSPFLSLAGFHYGANTIPELGPDASGSFQGSLSGPLTNPVLEGDLAIRHFRLDGQTWSQLQSHLVFSQTALSYRALALDADVLHAQATGRISLADWRVQQTSSFETDAHFKNLDLDRLMAVQGTWKSVLASGKASGALHVSGSLENPSGSAQLTVSHLDAYGQRLNQVQADAKLAGDEIRIDHGRLQSGPAALGFTALYRRSLEAWSKGQLLMRLDSNGFPLHSISVVNRRVPELDAQLEAHGDVVASVSNREIRPMRADGTVLLRGITFGGRRYGTVLFRTQTSGDAITALLSGGVEQSPLRGSASLQLTRDLPLKADLQFGELNLRDLASMLALDREMHIPLSGVAQGSLSLHGPLEDPRHWHSQLRLATLQFKPDSGPADISFRNSGPVEIEADDGIATIRNLRITGNNTNLSAAGTIGLLDSRPLNINVNGSAGLQLLELLDAKLDSTGESSLSAAISGSLANPSVNGTLKIANGSFFLQDVTNGLTGVNGTILFNKDRATIQTLTAESGGGTLRLGGFVTFGTPGPLIYGLQAQADKVRLRYAGGISVTANADLRLSGSSTSSLLSGTTTVSRVVLGANTDLGNVFANFAVPTPAPANRKDFVTGLRFDVRIESSQDLQLNTALSRDLEAGIDLRLRGTPDRPVLLGSVTANQGDIRVFGTRYTINRGEVTFVNAVKIEPVLDVDLQTETRGITVDITVAGALNKLNINYRSDPPLQPRDIIALLAIGRAPSDVTAQQSAEVSSEATTLQSGTYAALGQAVSPASNRLSKLFGVTNIKIDPLVESTTYTSQARLTLEQQLSRDITVTYITNLSQTAEQIFRVEWALNRQYSVVALRDDNGAFGIDFLYKKRFK